MPTKQQLTLTVIELLANQSIYDFESAMIQWWQDHRNDGGMRLTNVGYECFSLAGLESWQFEIDVGPLKPIQLLMLKQHLIMPYYIGTGKKRSLTFYGSKEAAVFALYNNIDKFVVALKNYNQI